MFKMAEYMEKNAIQKIICLVLNFWERNCHNVLLQVAG